MNKDNTVRQAGGFIIQLLPFTDEKNHRAAREKNHGNEICHRDVRRRHDTGDVIRRNP